MKLSRLFCPTCLALDVGFFVVPVRLWERYPARFMILLGHVHKKSHRTP